MLNQPFVLELFVNEQHRAFQKEAAAHRAARKTKSDLSRQTLPWNQRFVPLGQYLVGRVQQLAKQVSLLADGAFTAGYRQKKVQ
jgi:hypothetical protein